jgi:hypothetical protein
VDGVRGRPLLRRWFELRKQLGLANTVHIRTKGFQLDARLRGIGRTRVTLRFNQRTHQKHFTTTNNSDTFKPPPNRYCFWPLMFGPVPTNTSTRSFNWNVYPLTMPKNPDSSPRLHYPPFTPTLLKINKKSHRVPKNDFCPS